MKPSLDVAGPADAPIAVPATAGLTPGVLHDTIVIPFNDPDALDRTLEANRGEVAAFIVEPVMENMRHTARRCPATSRLLHEITGRHGTMLIFDEVKNRQSLPDTAAPLAASA